MEIQRVGKDSLILVLEIRNELFVLLHPLSFRIPSMRKFGRKYTTRANTKWNI
jgi:hypothetical protein